MSRAALLRAGAKPSLVGELRALFGQTVGGGDPQWSQDARAKEPERKMHVTFASFGGVCGGIDTRQVLSDLGLLVSQCPGKGGCGAQVAAQMVGVGALNLSKAEAHIRVRVAQQQLLGSGSGGNTAAPALLPLLLLLLPSPPPPSPQPSPRDFLRLPPAPAPRPPFPPLLPAAAAPSRLWW